jgi:hypothetical protein
MYSVMMEEAPARQLLQRVRTQFTAMVKLWNRRLLEKMMCNNCLEKNRDLSNNAVRWCEIVFLYTVISGARENLGFSSWTEDHREQVSCRCGLVFLHRRSKNVTVIFCRFSMVCSIAESEKSNSYCASNLLNSTQYNLNSCTCISLSHAFKLQPAL